MNSIPEQGCSIDVSFSHADYDYLTMRISAHGRVLSETTNREISCWVSSVFCPFSSLIAWLEAITSGMESCGFTWDAEGPTGQLAMKW